jgi:hypothetical protein
VLALAADEPTQGARWPVKGSYASNFRKETASIPIERSAEPLMRRSFRPLPRHFLHCRLLDAPGLGVGATVARFHRQGSHALASELMRGSARARGAVKTERGTHTPLRTAFGLFDCAALPRVRANRIEAAISVASQSKGNDNEQQANRQDQSSLAPHLQRVE